MDSGFILESMATLSTEDDSIENSDVSNYILDVIVDNAFKKSASKISYFSV